MVFDVKFNKEQIAVAAAIDIHNSKLSIHAAINDVTNFLAHSQFCLKKEKKNYLQFDFKF